MFTMLIAVVFTLVLVVGVPALSYSSARNAELENIPRVALYASAVLFQWLLTLIGVGVTHLAARSVLFQGFARVPLVAAVLLSVGIASASLLAITIVVLCERHGWLPPESKLVHFMIPQSLREKLWVVLIVSPTAAFCEEFLFRGFLLTEMHMWLHSLGWAWAVSSVAFGLAHFYQGWSGMVRAALLGALLAYPVVHFGSLYPAMLAHWIIDTLAFLWLGPWLTPGTPGVESEARTR